LDAIKISKKGNFLMKFFLVWGSKIAFLGNIKLYNPSKLPKEEGYYIIFSFSGESK
jgi:hypothetical protein